VSSKTLLIALVSLLTVALYFASDCTHDLYVSTFDAESSILLSIIYLFFTVSVFVFYICFFVCGRLVKIEIKNKETTGCHNANSETTSNGSPPGAGNKRRT